MEEGRKAASAIPLFSPLPLFCVSKSHDVVTGVNKQYVSCDCTGERATEKEGGVTDLALFNVATQGRNDIHLFANLGQARDSAGGEGIQGTSGDGVDANVMLSKFVGQIAHAALQGGFGDGHDVIFWHYALTGHVGHGQHTAATACLHQRGGALGHGDKGISADIKGSVESFASRVIEGVFKLARRGIGNGMDKYIKLAVKNFASPRKG